MGVVSGVRGIVTIFKREKERTKSRIFLERERSEHHQYWSDHEEEEELSENSLAPTK